MTELQAEDPDIAPILRLRLQQTEQSQPEEDCWPNQKQLKFCGANGIISDWMMEYCIESWKDCVVVQQSYNL